VNLTVLQSGVDARVIAQFTHANGCARCNVGPGVDVHTNFEKHEIFKERQTIEGKNLV